VFGESEALVQDNPRWRGLCDQASKEQDPKKLIALIKEINDILEAKRHRLGDAPPPKQTA
jgi:hypothetical protein